MPGEDAMPFNRINGFYVGRFTELESQSMNIDDQNDELNEALGTRLSQLNAAIEAHEKALKAMMVPRTVAYMYRCEEKLDENGENTGADYCHYYIAMVKWQGTWRLCHDIVEPFDHSNSSNWKPLVDCSISDRLQAAPHLDKLRTKIVEEKKKIIPELEGAIERLARSLDNFGDKPGRK
jgi:hypothetical protein